MSSKCQNLKEQSFAAVPTARKLSVPFFHFHFPTATFDQSSKSPNECDQTQSQYNPSAMFTLWNLIADLIESNDQKEDQQQQITDFYSKTAATLPRIACMMQLYFNAMSILDELHETVLYSEGDNNDLSINENFVISAQSIIKNKFYTYDQTYIPCDQVNQAPIDPMVIVRRDTVLAAWKWYANHLNIATKLFTIDYFFSAKPVSPSSAISSGQKTLKQLIMLFSFNIFPLAALTDKHPISRQTCVY